MNVCDGCGNAYDKTFTVSREGRTLTFDSFECAINKMAPRCSHCDTIIIGHGVEHNGDIYCCAHCAEELGAHGLRDRVDRLQ